MDRRSKKILAIERRQAKEFIRCNWPPGTLLKHKVSGKKFMIGKKFGMSNFWLLDYSRSKKGILPATQVKEQFEEWTDEALQNYRRMDRRSFTKLGLGSLAVGGAVGLGKSIEIAKQELVKVEVLKHHPETRYETLKEFNTKEEAEEFVRSLMPRLVYVKTITRVALSGYRGDIRNVLDSQIQLTVYEIIDSRTKEVAIEYIGYDGYYIFECGRAWAIIENIRVDGKPVDLKPILGSSISPLLTQPFDKGNPTVEDVLMDISGTKEIRRTITEKGKMPIKV